MLASCGIRRRLLEHLGDAVDGFAAGVGDAMLAVGEHVRPSVPALPRNDSVRAHARAVLSFKQKRRVEARPGREIRPVDRKVLLAVEPSPAGRG